MIVGVGPLKSSVMEESGIALSRLVVSNIFIVQGSIPINVAPKDRSQTMRLLEDIGK